MYPFNIIFNNYRNTTKGKEIHQYSLEGNYINTFKSVIDASSILEISNENISAASLGKRKQAGGFMWREYKVDYINPYRKNLFMKEVHMYTKDGEYIKSYPSARHIDGFEYKVISKCCNGKSKTYKGYRFSFEKKERI